MKPPKCAVCSKKFRIGKKEGALVAFKLNAEEIVKKEEMEKKGYLGHPVGEVWFCNKHLKLARTYTHLSVIEAFKEIRRIQEENKSNSQRIKDYFYSFMK